MLNFPSYNSSLLIIAIFIAGCLLAVSTFFDIRSYERARRKALADRRPESAADVKEPPPIRTALAVLGSAVFIIFGGIGFYLEVTDIYRLRNINIDDVESLKIYRTADEHSTDFTNERFIDDRTMIREGLGKLHRCSELSRNHESWKDGYRIQLILRDGNKEHTISAFKNSTSMDGRSGVMTEPTTGVYLCADFQEWIRNNVDPLFAKSPQ